LALALAGAERGLPAEEHRVTTQPFGKTADGSQAHLFTVANPRGLLAKLTDYGARLVALECPDRTGRSANVTLGFGTLKQYEAHTAYFGCTTGRYANRIGKARFVLDGQEYRLAANNGDNHLHGGKKGLDRYVWGAQAVARDGAAGVRFTHSSPDGDEGYPGRLDLVVTFWVTDDSALRIDYEAQTSKPTVLNLTNHAYWNLAGSGDVLGQTLELAADHYLEVDAGMIPTGVLAPVEGTFMDFRKPLAIGARMEETKKRFPPPGGYDHCYVLRKKPGELALAAKAHDPASGRVMELLTTEPAVQLYTSNFLDGSAVNGGFKQHAAFCLETQHYPDSPNRPEFPTTVLRPGQTYRQTTIYRFSVAR